MKIAEEKKLYVRISKATEVVWEGDALSVSSVNSDGPFDILGMHSNFITLVKDNPIKIVTLDNEEKIYKFKQTVIYVHDNKVKIFSNIT
jgi:F0F1-type ATP synthase epsilon subunit